RFRLLALLELFELLAALELLALLPPLPALTESPTWPLRVSTVPLMGALSVVSSRFCCAVCTACWSLASVVCSVTVSAFSVSWSLVMVFWCCSCVIFAWEQLGVPAGGLGPQA